MCFCLLLFLTLFLLVDSDVMFLYLDTGGLPTVYKPQLSSEGRDDDRLGSGEVVGH